MADKRVLNENEPMLPEQTKRAASAIGKLLFFSCLMFTLPFGAFFGTKAVLKNYLDVVGFANTCWAVVLAVVTVNLIIVVYAYIAYLEPDYDEQGNIIQPVSEKKKE